MTTILRDSGLDQKLYDGARTHRDAFFYNNKGKLVESPAYVGAIADTHAHLDMNEDPGLALAQAAAVGVKFIGVVTDIDENAEATYTALPSWVASAQTELEALKEREAQGELTGILDPNLEVPRLRITVGCHPHNAKDYTPEMEAQLIALAQNPLTSCIGEIGLDYHYDLSPRDTQREIFARQINLAKELDLPIAMHIREAHDEALEIIEREGLPARGAILHCYTSDPDTLKPFIELGCYVAFGGAMTFKKSEEIREAAKLVPTNKLLTETDSPFMAPDPLRGTLCTPAHTLFTACRLAEIRGEFTEEFFSALYNNAIRILD